MTERLSREELEDFWALEVPLESKYVPLDELARAVKQSRVKYAFSTSSMGTAETYWSVVAADRDASTVGDDCVVLPPGQIARETPWEDWLDDRDVVGALWKPFWGDQEHAIRTRLSADALPKFLAELKRVRAAKKSERDALRFEALRIGVRLARGR